MSDQKLFDAIKYGFTEDEVFIRITPLHKKSISQTIQLYDIPNDPSQRFVEVTETYRWGYGYLEGEDLNWQNTLSSNFFHCDPMIGHGAELDDLISVVFEYDGPWTDEEKQNFETLWENGDPDDPDGRNGFGWAYDWTEDWQIEDDFLEISGPVKLDIVDKTDYNKVYIEDYKISEESIDV